MSPRWRLYASAARFRARKLSGFGRFFNEGTSLVARRCTFSIAVICFLSGWHVRDEVGQEIYIDAQSLIGLNIQMFF